MKVGRPLKYKTVEELQEAIDAYFALNPERPTVTGLALELGFTDRRSLYDYKEREVFFDIIEKAMLKIESMHKDNLYASDRVLTNKKHKGVGYVYIVKCGDFNLYKVGVSKSKPKQRLSSLQSGCPFPLYMIELHYCNYYSLLESEIHKRYKKYNKMGEWFELTDAQLLCLKSEIEEQSTKQINLF